MIDVSASRHLLIACNGRLAGSSECSAGAGNGARRLLQAHLACPSGPCLTSLYSTVGSSGSSAADWLGLAAAQCTRLGAAAAVVGATTEGMVHAACCCCRNPALVGADPFDETILWARCSGCTPTPQPHCDARPKWPTLLGVPFREQAAPLRLQRILFGFQLLETDVNCAHIVLMNPGLVP